MNRSLGTNRISKRHRRFLADVFSIYAFDKIDDFQRVTMAGFEICALLDIDSSKRPFDKLLPNLYQKFNRCSNFTDKSQREPLESLSPERIKHIRAQVREKLNLHFYSVEVIEDPEKLRRLDKARIYDQKVIFE